MKLYQIRGTERNLSTCDYRIIYVSDTVFNDLETAVATLHNWYVKDCKEFDCVPCLKRGQLISYSCKRFRNVHFIYSIYEIEVA